MENKITDNIIHVNTASEEVTEREGGGRNVSSPKKIDIQVKVKAKVNIQVTCTGLN